MSVTASVPASAAPSAALPATSREVRLLTRPEGLPDAGHLAVVEVPLPVPGPGEILVRNRYFHVGAAVRTLIGGGVPGAPLPALRPGDTLLGAAVGEVVTAAGPDDGGDGQGPRVGELVSHWLGWREYAVLPAEGVTRLGGAPLVDPALHLTQGWTAYVALTVGAGLRPGDTVFVTGAAGSVGTAAGRIARLLGAGRVVGSAGSAAKARRLVDELGYDAAVVRGAGPIAGQLAEAAPEGIDVLVDTVGGEQLAAAVGAARPGARFALVGALSGQLSPDGSGTAAPVGLDSVQLVVKRIALRGVSPLDHPETLPEWREHFAGWLDEGLIDLPVVRIAGMDGAPRALEEVFAGQHVGTVVVAL
ncbi:MDR family NADP-dependent oxidoreductase [Kitasatospora sp. NPDC004240]